MERTQTRNYKDYSWQLGIKSNFAQDHISLRGALPFVMHPNKNDYLSTIFEKPEYLTPESAAILRFQVARSSFTNWFKWL